MIAECLAYYGADQRYVGVSAVIQDDAGASLHQHLKTAQVKLLYLSNSFLTKQLEPQDYNPEAQMFYCFFVNPPLEQDLQVLLEVETREGWTAKIKTPVKTLTTLPYPGVATNPVLPTRPPLNFSDSTNQLNGVKTPL